MLLASLWLAGAELARADPQAASPCQAVTPDAARLLADALYERGEYQRAALCYDAAGDRSHAQQAFLRAVEPNAQVSARGLRKESNTAKALFTQAQRAFGGR
jgi:hypothetical protein